MTDDKFPQSHVGDGASITAPFPDLEWSLRYGDAHKHRLIVASILAGYRYLILERTKDEAWHRIKAMRQTLKAV